MTVLFVSAAACARSNGDPGEWKATGFASISTVGRRARRRQRISVSIRPVKIWGVLYRITRRDLVHLDSTEGVPGRRYRHLWIAAEDMEGRPLQAVTYIADGNPVDGNPSLRYLTLLREGARAHGLPEHWISFLKNVNPAE